MLQYLIHVLICLSTLLGSTIKHLPNLKILHAELNLDVIIHPLQNEPFPQGLVKDPIDSFFVWDPCSNGQIKRCTQSFFISVTSFDAQL